ncbi:potassium sodium hyperpolarization-activated cyclic nucleotide-gated channel 2 isoform X5 [Brachionus plicatilis]|uniref:Potassium sodium hyperpolarization-activated cyclic nucleotide-gated channel 2 isoform X5 n=1 Tax=Brachionus plicatilis TaxID=10195 RepID=A0A3M7RE25_BRAPC|nr:potassium sodium hyperpolarization-activated cyclic nucleotide-gated channel 2 isoform X5 [Brachionus plicatilis]
MPKKMIKKCCLKSNYACRMIPPPIIKFDIHDQNAETKTNGNQHSPVIDQDDDNLPNGAKNVQQKSSNNVHSRLESKFVEKKIQTKQSPVFMGKNEFWPGTIPPVEVTIEPSGSISSLSREESSKNPVSSKHHSFSLPSKHSNQYRSTSQLYATHNGHLAGPALAGSIHSLLNLRANVCKKNLNECDCETCANLLKDFMGKPGQDLFNNESSDFSEPKATYSYLKSYFVSMLQPSDNKLAMKLFGSKKGVLKEKLRQQEVGHWIIHPCSNFRFYWDLVMLILLIANVIILPVAISFFNDNWSHTGLLIFNLVSDSLFLLDIVVNFRTEI